MRIVPALDVMGGRAVRGRGGRRGEYRPEPSVLAAGADPFRHAKTLAEVAGGAIYLADLEAILGTAPFAAKLLGALRSAGVETWADAGARTLADIAAIRAAGAARVVVGTETWRGPGFPNGAADLLFSLDMMDGQLLAPAGVWPHCDAEALAEGAAEQGVRAILLLDLADVGAHCGPRTLPLLGRLRRRFPDVEWLLGGGVRGLDDLRRCRDAGAAGVLVASALHDGRLAPADLAAFRAEPRADLPAPTR